MNATSVETEVQDTELDVLAEDVFDTSAGLAEARHNNVCC